MSEYMCYLLTLMLSLHAEIIDMVKNLSSVTVFLAIKTCYILSGLIPCIVNSTSLQYHTILSTTILLTALAAAVLTTPVNQVRDLDTREALPEPIGKGHLGGSGNGKREAVPEPEPLGKGRLGKDGGNSGGSKSDGEPEPLGRGRLGKDGGSGDA